MTDAPEFGHALAARVLADRGAGDGDAGAGHLTIIRVAARDGRSAAMSAVLGNSGGVLAWGLPSAAGVSSLIIASRLAYDALRLGGAAVLIVLGLACDRNPLAVKNLLVGDQA